MPMVSKSSSFSTSLNLLFLYKSKFKGSYHKKNHKIMTFRNSFLPQCLTNCTQMQTLEGSNKTYWCFNKTAGSLTIGEKTHKIGVIIKEEIYQNFLYRFRSNFVLSFSNIVKIKSVSISYPPRLKSEFQLIATI